MHGYTTVPYVIAYSNELVDDRIWFDRVGGRLRLAYQPPREGDWYGTAGSLQYASCILRARVRDLRDQPPEVRGHERMRRLNTGRQWRCMDELWCQVCGRPASDPDTGRTPWLLVSTVFEATGTDAGRTNAPPCCWDCIPKALKECRMLRAEWPWMCTVERVTTAGVLADVYRPTPTGLPSLQVHNAFVSWTDARWHPYALAVAQVVELHGMARFD